MGTTTLSRTGPATYSGAAAHPVTFTTGNQEIRAIRSLDDLDFAEPQWRELAEARGGPMLGPDWSRVCAQVFGASLETLVCSGPGGAAVAPLAAVPGHRRRREFIGIGQLGEPMDFLYSDPSLVQPLADEMCRRKYSVLLRRIPVESPVVGALERAYQGSGFVLVRPSTPFPRLILDASWSDPERHLNSGRRSDLRRMGRIAAQMGNVEFECAAPDRVELSARLGELYEVEHASWKGSAGTSLLSRPEQGEFFRRYAADAAERGALRLCVMRIDGRAAAVQLAVVHGLGFWLFKIGYREEFARCSPGMLLMNESIRYAAQLGLTSFEFLGSDEPWLRLWKPQVCACVSIGAYPLRVDSLAGLARDGMQLARTKVAAVLNKKDPGAEAHD